MSVTFTVTGRGRFPVDMLRYDCAWPQGPDDAALITESFSADTRQLTPFCVTLTSDMKCGVPTVGRWTSFGCAVEIQP